MKISKRTEVCGICTASLWWIARMTYFIMKMNNNYVFDLDIIKLENRKNK